MSRLVDSAKCCGALTELPDHRDLIQTLKQSNGFCGFPSGIIR